MSADSNSTLGVGAQRRQFRMKACLGRGGFGEVYRATMISPGNLQTEVAVKVLHAEVDPDSQAVQRLRDEGRLLGAVRHPSALKVYDMCLLDGRVALVTEFVEGQDLDRCLDGADPMPLRALVEVIGRVADALHVAYTAPSPRGGPLELVHRDIKPANIRIGLHGEVKLLDFGIARSTNLEREAHTETHAMLGSYLYMAPERFLEGADQGTAVDTFALGCVLYEGIAHKRLFGEMSLREIYLLVLDEEKFADFVDEQLDRLPLDTPTEVLQLLSRLLELDPERRPSHDVLSKACHGLADVLPGKTLDRWARGRVWPPARTVRGMLDGAVVTESGIVSRMTPPPLPERLEEPAGETIERSLTPVRTVSATFERPTVVVGVGLAGGLLGAGVVALIAVVALGAVIWYLAGSMSDQVVNVEIEQPILPEPPPEPVPVLPPPRPAPAIVAPPPRPVPPPEPEPERVIRVQPVPVPVPVPPPTPVPAPAPVEAAPATITVDGGVLVEFRGDAGTFRSGRVPPGSYDAFAYWEPGKPERATSFHVTPGQQLTIGCSKLRRECTVQ